MDAHARRRLCWEARRGREPRDQPRWRAPHPVPWCRRWGRLFSHHASAPCACANTDGGHGAGPVGSASRGGPPRGATPLWGQQKQYLSRASAPPWRPPTRRVLALTQQWRQQRRDGEERSTRGNQPGAPDASQGWTVGLRARATRVLWALPGGRQNRQRFHQARRLVCQVSAPPRALTLLTAGAQR